MMFTAFDPENRQFAMADDHQHIPGLLLSAVAAIVFFVLGWALGRATTVDTPSTAAVAAHHLQTVYGKYGTWR
jgi:hypothetical protein